MGLEWIAFIIIVLGLAELKEWRQSKRDEHSMLILKSMRRHIDALMATTQMLSEECKRLCASEEKRADEFERVQEFVLAADMKLSTILREYELNGVPLGYQRKNLDTADYIEGL